MVTKVPSPFASPFAKTLLAVFWLAYLGMLVALAIEQDINLLAIVAWWTFALPWISWAFLSGVQVEPGRRVGGGPMYPRVALEPGEALVFAAPVFIGRSGGHVFITNHRLIALPARLFGRFRALRLSDITSVETRSKGIGWPMPKRRLHLTVDGGSTLSLAPWAEPSLAGSRLAAFMGTMSADAFFNGALAALESGGVSVPTTS